MSLVKDGYQIKRRRDDGPPVKSYYYRTTRRIYYQPSYAQKDLGRQSRTLSSSNFDKKYLKQRLIRKTEQVTGYEDRNRCSFRIFRSTVSTYDLSVNNNNDKNLYLEPLTDYENCKKIENKNNSTHKTLLPYDNVHLQSKNSSLNRRLTYEGNHNTEYSPHVEYYDKVFTKPERKTNINEPNSQEYVNLSDDNFNVYNRNLAKKEIRNKTNQYRHNEGFYKDILSSTDLDKNTQKYPLQRTSGIHPREMPRIDENFYENFLTPEIFGNQLQENRKMKVNCGKDAKLLNLKLSNSEQKNSLDLVTEPIQLKPRRVMSPNNTGRTYYDAWLSLK